MESLLLIIAIVVLVLDIDERRAARHDHSSSVWQATERDEGCIRQLTDRAVLNMMNEIRRHEPGQQP